MLKHHVTPSDFTAIERYMHVSKNILIVFNKTQEMTRCVMKICYMYLSIKRTISSVLNLLKYLKYAPYRIACHRIFFFVSVTQEKKKQ